MEQPETKKCGNCMEDISVGAFPLHEAHCYRHNIRCKDCGEVIHKGDEEEHFKEKHSKETCECGLEVPKDVLAIHKEMECTSRTQLCDWCALNIKIMEVDEHRRVCGSRTETCEKCDRYVKLCDFDQHQITNCQYPPVEQRADTTRRTPAEEMLDQFRARALDDFVSFDGRENTVLPDPTPAMHNDGGGADRVQCPFCDEICPNFEEFQVHRHTSCKAMAASAAGQASAGAMAAAADVVDLTGDESRPARPLQRTPYVDPHPSQVIEIPEDDADVSLPCEFCGTNFPMAVYPDHVTVCQIQHEYNN